MQQTANNAFLSPGKLNVAKKQKILILHKISSFFLKKPFGYLYAILWPSGYLQQISVANNFQYSATNEKNMGKTTAIVGSTHNKRDFLATISKDALVNFLASISPTHIVH